MNHNAKGCNYLIKSQQAILLENPQHDIVKGLSWDVKEIISTAKHVCGLIR